MASHGDPSLAALRPPVSIQAIIDDLLRTTGASRVTLRQETPGDVFPVTHEALAAEASSIRDVATPNMEGQPVVLRVLAGEQVVQADCTKEFPGDEPFHRMLELYGGMRAQIVTPARRDGKTVAIVSVHQLGRTRDWTRAEIEACSDAVSRILALLPGT